jgi:hypothetical protein
LHEGDGQGMIAHFIELLSVQKKFLLSKIAIYCLGESAFFLSNGE